MIWILFSFSCTDYNFFFRNEKENIDPDISLAETEGESIIPIPECENNWDLNVALEQSEVCYSEQQTGLLDVVVEWKMDDYQDYLEWGQSVMAPVIGQLTDDNGDGRIDSSDNTDIVIITDDAGLFPAKNGIIRILQGFDGGMVDAVGEAFLDNFIVYPYRYSNVALGDVDADGLPEIIFIAEVIEIIELEDSAVDSGVDTALVEEPGSESGSEPEDNPIRPPPPSEGSSSGGNPDDNPETPKCRVVSMNPQMQLEWVGAIIEEGCGGHAPAIADLNGDGFPEVVLGPYILDGSNGELIAKGVADQGRNLVYAEIGMNSVPVDLDANGYQEVIAGRSIYESNGAFRCQNDASYDGFNAAADFDMDGIGEVLLVGGGEVTIFEKDCETIARWILPGSGTGGPPTVADYDGDGLPEIGIVDGEFYSVFQPDGSLLWSKEVSDLSSHATGSVVFDFEEDAYPEVVYADEENLWILDGLTGAVRLQFPEHGSRTLHEYPTIADLDNDGSAEIIIVNGGGHDGSVATGITVLGSETSNWPSARQVWNQHAYFISNVNEDLSIPRRPIPNWDLYNNFRSGDISQQIGADLPDALLDIDICIDECQQGNIEFAIQIGNQGLSILPPTAQILVYTDNDEIIASRELGVVIPIMDVSEFIEFEIDYSLIQNGILGVEISAMDCGDGNDRVQKNDIICPSSN